MKGKSLKGADLADGTITSKQVGLESLNASDVDGFEIADDSPTRVVAERVAARAGRGALGRAARPSSTRRAT